DLSSHSFRLLSSRPSCVHLLFLVMRPHPGSTPFPYTTLFRSPGRRTAMRGRKVGDRHGVPVHTIRNSIWSIGERAMLSPTIQDRDRKSTRLNSSHGSISYAVFCLKKKNKSKE